MTYTLAIGDRTYSSWSLRGWLLFAKFDIPVTVKHARMKSPEFTEMLKDFGGGRTVPAMKDGDIIVSDSLAMAETLADRFASMWPSDPKAKGVARSIVSEMHAGFFALREACTMNLRTSYEGFQASDAVLKDVERIENIWRDARTRFGSDGPWLFGKYSIADVFYAPVATRFATYGLPTSEVSQAYIETTVSDKIFRQWRARGLAENYIQPGYDLDLPETPFAGHIPITAKQVKDKVPINSVCPFSGKPVVEDCLIEINETVIGVCNPFCRDKVIADPEAWPEVMAQVQS